MLSATGGPPPNAKPGQAPTHLVLDLAQPGYLVLNRRKFPFWQVLVNGHSPNRSPLPPALGGSLGKEFPLPSLLWNIDQRRQSRTDGLIVVILPAGHSTIDLVYRRTPDQTAGLGLSGISALIAIGLTRKRRLD